MISNFVPEEIVRRCQINWTRRPVNTFRYEKTMASKNRLRHKLCYFLKCALLLKPKMIHTIFTNNQQNKIGYHSPMRNLLRLTLWTRDWQIWQILSKFYCCQMGPLLILYTLRMMFFQTLILCKICKPKNQKNWSFRPKKKFAVGSYDTFMKHCM